MDTRPDSITTMPAKLEGPLDHGALEDIKSDITVRSQARATRWSLDVVRPEFLTLRPSSPKKLLRRTAWLDGLRGFAAFMVYLHHHQLWSHDTHGNSVFENSFGYNKHHYFAALPFIRHFFSGGHFAVAIFFVLSGYVLSVKCLGALQKSHHMVSADAVSSALFRRWLRLYLPVIGFTLAWMIVRHWTNVWVDFGERNDTWAEDFKTWYYAFKNYSFVFLTGDNDDFTRKYNGHLWSIPIGSSNTNTMGTNEMTDGLHRVQGIDHRIHRNHGVLAMHEKCSTLVRVCANRVLPVRR